MEQLASAWNSYPDAAALSHKAKEFRIPCQLIVAPEQLDTGPRCSPRSRCLPLPGRL